MRTGRMTEAQDKAYQTLWDEFGLVCQYRRLDLRETFGRDAPVVFEIGFGMGDSLLNQALNEPGRDFVGVEVHKPGVGRLMNEAKKAGVTNLRVICEDAVEVLSDGLGPSPLKGYKFIFRIHGIKASSQTTSRTAQIHQPACASRALGWVLSFGNRLGSVC